MSEKLDTESLSALTVISFKVCYLLHKENQGKVLFAHNPVSS